MLRYEVRTLNQPQEALVYVEEFRALPTFIESVRNFDGWRRVPKNRSEVVRLAREGIEASSIRVVMLCWLIE